MSEVEYMQIFGDNLREIMEEQGYDQRTLAESTNISQASISNYVNGRTMPTLRSIINMSYELGISLNDFADFGDRLD